MPVLLRCLGVAELTGVAMKHIAKIMTIGILIALFLAPSGCAFFTAERVAIMAGKHVAKKTYENWKEEREEKNRREREQRVEQTSHEEPR